MMENGQKRKKCDEKKRQFGVFEMRMRAGPTINLTHLRFQEYNAQIDIHV